MTNVECTHNLYLSIVKYEHVEIEDDFTPDFLKVQ